MLSGVTAPVRIYRIHPAWGVAADAGFGTTASMRAHLHAAIGVAPLAYRRTYRGPVAHPM